MSQIAKEYARLKLRKLKLAAMIVGFIVGTFALVGIFAAIIFAPIWIPGELIKAGYPNLGVAVFIGSILLIGGYLWWPHSDIKKAIENTKEGEVGGSE